MPKSTPAPLSSAEFAALKDVSVSPPSRAIPGRIQSQLLRLGYVQEVLGNLVITDDGIERLAVGK
jgi:hypothetical protein